jgi:membrane metallo-endopeptidase-like protein 1
MQYAVARVFTDHIYPDDAAKQRIHNATNKIAQSIRTSFETMLDGLDWMDAASKKGAYAKVADLVVNIAYPPWILDNTTLDAYHAALDITPADTFFTIQDKFTVFANYLQYASTDPTVVIDRTVFNGPPSTVNAWYQPEFNSITFPEGILQMPFFNPDWPASLNFGAMGLVSGHELTHGFDDQGVQWNSLGGLNNWLDASSAQGFKQMASCVIDEYGKFCPLNATQYSPNCLNGENTQGENIADNGGIHASFRAYRTHVNLNGPDPQLPDPVFGQFTHDQLFFLQFGQIWCQAPPKPADIFTQILVDVHSPSLFRVFGSIQNFPAFRNAYHCPYDSVYSPAKHCNVWVPFHPY